MSLVVHQSRQESTVTITTVETSATPAGRFGQDVVSVSASRLTPGNDYIALATWRQSTPDADNKLWAHLKINGSVIDRCTVSSNNHYNDNPPTADMPWRRECHTLMRRWTQTSGDCSLGFSKEDASQDAEVDNLTLTVFDMTDLVEGTDFRYEERANNPVWNVGTTPVVFVDTDLDRTSLVDQICIANIVVGRADNTVVMELEQINGNNAGVGIREARFQNRSGSSVASIDTSSAAGFGMITTETGFSPTIATLGSERIEYNLAVSTPSNSGVTYVGDALYGAILALNVSNIEADFTSRSGSTIPTSKTAMDSVTLSQGATERMVFAYAEVEDNKDADVGRLYVEDSSNTALIDTGVGISNAGVATDNPRRWTSGRQGDLGAREIITLFDHRKVNNVANGETLTSKIEGSSTNYRNSALAVFTVQSPLAQFDGAEVDSQVTVGAELTLVPRDTIDNVEITSTVRIGAQLTSRAIANARIEPPISTFPGEEIRILGDFTGSQGRRWDLFIGTSTDGIPVLSGVPGQSQVTAGEESVVFYVPTLGEGTYSVYGERSDGARVLFVSNGLIVGPRQYAESSFSQKSLFPPTYALGARNTFDAGPITLVGDAPTAPSIDSPIQGIAETITGTSAFDGATITVFSDGVAIAVTTVANGNWSAIVPAQFGDEVITATATNANGESAESAPVTVMPGGLP